MTGDKQDPKVDPKTPVEGEKLGEAEGDAKTQEPKEELTVEGLTQKLAESTQELERKDAHIKTLQGSLRAEQQRGAPKAEIDKLYKKIEEMETSHAALRDFLEANLGEGETKVEKKTHSQQLAEKRAEASKEKPEEKITPEVQELVDYVRSQGFAFDGPEVKEAIADDRTPQEALKYLKDKVGAKNKTDIDAQVAEKVAQALKDKGLSAGGPGGPSAASKSVEDMTASEKLAYGFQELKKEKK